MPIILVIFGAEAVLKYFILGAIVSLIVTISYIVINFSREKNAVGTIFLLLKEIFRGIIAVSVKIEEDFQTLLEETVSYGTVGEDLPGLYAYYGEKQIDLSGLTSRAQIISILSTELDILPDDEKIILLAVE